MLEPEEIQTQETAAIAEGDCFKPQITGVSQAK
jgi:hypothetical protein